MVHRFTREELYALVWSKLMSKLAKELSVSDVAVAKACRRAGIPSPDVGYWAKVRHGKKVARTPLPPSPSKTTAVVQISLGPSNLLRGLAPEAQEKIANESSEEWRISVPKRLSHLHHLLHPWREEDRTRERSTPPYGQFHRPPNRDAKVERRLGVLNALFHALEKRGHKIVANPQNPLDLDLVVDGERIEFSLSERQKQIKEELTPEESRKPWNAIFGVKSRITLQPTGILIFKIHTWLGTGVRTQWAEGARGPLENRLNEIVAGLLAVAGTIRQHRLEREEDERRRRAEEEARMKREEAQRNEARRLTELIQLVNHWHQAVDIRAYVKAVGYAVRTGGFKIENRKLDEWTKWALGRADQIDPLVGGQPIAVGRFVPDQSTMADSKRDLDMTTVPSAAEAYTRAHETGKESLPLEALMKVIQQRHRRAFTLRGTTIGASYNAPANCESRP
jgi:hypothetical protein